MPMDPPSGKKKHGPLGQWTSPLERRITSQAIDAGEGWYNSGYLAPCHFSPTKTTPRWKGLLFHGT